MTLDDAAAHAGKSEYALTRRDVARWLLGTPRTTETVPRLRRELMASGFPLSSGFWTSAEDVLARIDAGQATVGFVQTWLEATGSEPTKIIGLHVWEVERERRPRAGELYEELVEHLEALVRTGVIDPDRLLAGDAGALRAYVAEQERWLTEPTGDGESRMDRLLDEADEEFLADWDVADAEFRSELDDLLDGLGERPCPQEELHAAAGRLRAGLASGDPPYDLLARGGGLAPRTVPAHDRELSLTLAAGVVDPADEPPDHYAPEVLSSWYTLAHVDWLCAVGELARRGVGTPAECDDLAGYVASSDLADGDLDAGDTEVLSAGFRTVTELWRALGAIGNDRRLTSLGWWGLPESAAPGMDGVRRDVGDHSPCRVVHLLPGHTDLGRCAGRRGVNGRTGTTSAWPS